MSTGIVDGTVIDKARGELLLSLLLARAVSGSAIRISSKKITVDKSGCRRYTTTEATKGEVGSSEEQPT